MFNCSVENTDVQKLQNIVFFSGWFRGVFYTPTKTINIYQKPQKTTKTQKNTHHIHIKTQQKNKNNNNPQNKQTNTKPKQHQPQQLSK